MTTRVESLLLRIYAHAKIANMRGDSARIEQLSRRVEIIAQHFYATALN